MQCNYFYKSGLLQIVNSILVFSLAVIGVAALAGCSKGFLDRYPQSQVSPEAFFNTEVDLAQYTNSFYSSLPGESIYQDDVSSDNVDPQGLSELVTGTRTVPSDASTAGWTWTNLRNINYFLEHYKKAAISDSIKQSYGGVARFFRAYFYFNKVQSFGDVPWYSTSLGTNSPELYKARDSRVLVIDSIIADLDFAATYIKTRKSNSYITKWAALALKSRVCLYEGTYRKYHNDLGLTESVSRLLTLAADAASNVINNGGYKLYSTGNPAADYGDLFALEDANLDEVILAHKYSTTYALKHSANANFNTSTLQTPGLTKDFIDNYLTNTGLPFSTVSGYETMEFPAEVKNRDPRLAQTIRTPGYKRRGGTTLLVPDFKSALTGYQCIKFVTSADQDGYLGNTNDLPIIRLAEVMLNYAEAKAELGSFTSADAAISLNLIRKRAGMPDFNLTSVPNDPTLVSQYEKTMDPLILAVRRERRVELVMEGFRRNDMLRWKEGPVLARSYKGMYVASFGNKDFNGDGAVDVGIYQSSSSVSSPISGVQYLYISPNFALTNGTSGYLDLHPGEYRAFDEQRDYLNPLPTTEILLNPKLDQNLGWE